MSPARKKIVVVGSSNTDMIVRTSRIPGPGETLLGGRFFMAAGGKGANQAVAAARAGGNVTFIARVGNDLFGRRAVQGFRRDGLSVKFVTRDPSAASGVALIIVDSRGENCITVAPGANAKLSTADIRRAGRIIAAADVLLLQLEVPIETVSLAAAIAAKHGVPVILNPAPARALPDKLLKNVTFLTPNKTEAEIFVGRKIKSDSDIAKAAGRLRQKAQAVVITLGARGSYVASADGVKFIPAFKVKAVDTTAAGDVFSGALAVALAEGNPPAKAARFASAAAALSITRLGAQPSAPFRAEVEKLLAKQSRSACKEKP